MHRRLHEERTIDPSTIAKVSGTVTATRFAPAIGPAVRVAMNEPSESVCRSILIGFTLERRYIAGSL